MKTDTFQLTIGFVPGYHHGHGDGSFAQDIGRRWQKLMAEDADGQPTDPVYVPAIVSDSRAIYLTAWGCPEGGEPTVTITSTRNPEYVTDADRWRTAVLRIAERLRKDLRQTTAQVAFFAGDFVYLKD